MKKLFIVPALAIGLTCGGCQDNSAPTPPPPPPPPVVSSTPVAAASPATSATPEAATPGKSATPEAKASTGKGLLEPFPGVPAPAIKKIVKVKFKTDLGDILIDVYPDAAPHAAKRFTELVEAGFYDNTPIFRIVPGFVAQFGINSDPKFKHYKEENFDDDPSYFKLAKGTLAFAKSGVNHNSTQVFIDYNDNSNLRGQGFTAFAAITKGYDLTERFKAVGNPQMGLDQEALWRDTPGTLKGLPEKPNMILKAEIVK